MESYSVDCPFCQKELKLHEGNYRCNNCNTIFSVNNFEHVNVIEYPKIKKAIKIFSILFACSMVPILIVPIMENAIVSQAMLIILKLLFIFALILFFSFMILNILLGFKYGLIHGKVFFIPYYRKKEPFIFFLTLMIWTGLLIAFIYAFVFLIIKKPDLIL